MILEQRKASPLITALRSVLLLVVGLILIVHAALSQQLSKPSTDKLVVQGIVLSADGLPVAGAKVKLQSKDTRGSQEKSTDKHGSFAFVVTKGDTYLLSAEKQGAHSSAMALPLPIPKTGRKIELVLSEGLAAESSRHASVEAMQFADQPNFTVAGVTDYTAAGGHGSDSSLRTGEALARETADLKPGNSGVDLHASQMGSESEDRLRANLVESPSSFEANHRLGEFYVHAGRNSEAVALLQAAYRIDATNRENEIDLALACKAIGDPVHSRKYVEELLARQESADLYRLAGELDESLGDSLAAVHEYQKAVTLDPSEQNFFSWGSELLLHRAIWQAQQVFQEGVKQYLASSRLLTGLGTALFAGAAYPEAATKLCQASDLNSLDPEPYIFLGKVQMASPDNLSCILERLHRFVQQQPGSAAANYLYAMALQKAPNNAPDAGGYHQSEAFLRNAIAIDPGYADAYLQLGILYASRKNYDRAIDLYSKAIKADPRLSDAYYRLAVAYNRTGQAGRAKEEFELHEEISKKQAAEVERQRQEVKQFVVELPSDSAHLPAK